MNYKIIGKYIKTIIFNIPNSQEFFLLSKNINNYKINIDITSNQIKDKIIEIATTLSLLPTKKDLEIIETKIIYSTIIELKENITDKDILKRIILIKVPSEIYPELRKIFVFMFESSGFKEIKISEKIDFEKLYKTKKH